MAEIIQICSIHHKIIGNRINKAAHDLTIAKQLFENAPEKATDMMFDITAVLDDVRRDMQDYTINLMM